LRDVLNTRSTDVAIQRSHHAYPREHRWPIMSCNQQKSLHRGLPFFGIVFCLGQFSDVMCRIAEGEQRFSARRYDWIEKLLIP
jgi:hypothetical protein